MSPGAGDASFWGHVPAWMWPIILVGVLAFFVYEAIKTWESVARIFGKFGEKLHSRQVLTRIQRIETLLSETNDKLECTTTYLVLDADYHHHADIVIAENAPALFLRLPKRMPFTEFNVLWKNGWRPDGPAEWP